MRIFSISGRVAHEAIPRKIEWKLRREAARGNREIPGPCTSRNVDRGTTGRWPISTESNTKNQTVPRPRSLESNTRVNTWFSIRSARVYALRIFQLRYRTLRFDGNQFETFGKILCRLTDVESKSFPFALFVDSFKYVPKNTQIDYFIDSSRVCFMRDPLSNLVQYTYDV